MVIDNRAPVAQFVDGSPLTDGMANLAASLMNAGPAAAQIRQQKQRQDLENLFRERQMSRMEQQDALQKLWHEQEANRQSTLDNRNMGWKDAETGRLGAYTQAQIDNMAADNTRQNLGMIGTGMNNAAARGIDMLKLLFHGGGKAGAAPKKERPNVRNFGSKDIPDWQQWNADDERWEPVELPQPAAPAPTSLPLSGEEKANMAQARESMNVAETGYPDREFNVYNPVDWFRSPPKPIAAGQPAAPAQAGAKPNKGSRSLSAAVKATGKDADTVRAELTALGYNVTP
jgi:hypothetical protein